MTLRIGINGFGRIGKIVYRLLANDPDVDVVAINDPAETGTLAHLLKYDSVHGIFNADIRFDEHFLYVNEKKTLIIREKEPSKIPRTDLGIDIVIESSGRFMKKALLQQHIDSGANRVILSCPAEDELDKTVIIGVNDNELLSKHRIISNASCTSNCIAPVLKILNEEFGIEQAFMNTVHPFTNNQSILDAPHKDLRRARTSGNNIIPTTTTAIKAVHTVMPYFIDRFDGIATRVPVPDGSYVELTALLKNNASVEAINELFRAKSSKEYRNIVEFCEDPIVSTDIIDNPHSAIFDSLATKVLKGKLIQIIVWYDNEFGYSNRMVDLIKILSKFENK
jgi:glyceraldehyde 3-phosphate dehydrogenase